MALTPIPTPLHGLPPINPGVSESLANMPDSFPKDISADVKMDALNTSAMQEKMAEMFSPPLVGDDILDLFEQQANEAEASGDTATATALRSTIASAQTANAFASPWVRVAVLWLIVSMLLKIISRIPGISGVPSLAKIMKDFQSGAQFTLYSSMQVYRGWSILNITTPSVATDSTTKGAIEVKGDASHKFNMWSNYHDNTWRDSTEEYWFHAYKGFFDIGFKGNYQTWYFDTEKNPYTDNAQRIFVVRKDAGESTFYCSGLDSAYSSETARGLEFLPVSGASSEGDIVQSMYVIGADLKMEDWDGSGSTHNDYPLKFGYEIEELTKGKRVAYVNTSASSDLDYASYTGVVHVKLNEEENEFSCGFAKIIMKDLENPSSYKDDIPLVYSDYNFVSNYCEVWCVSKESGDWYVHVLRKNLVCYTTADGNTKSNKEFVLKSDNEKWSSGRSHSLVIQRNDVTYTFYDSCYLKNENQVILNIGEKTYKSYQKYRVLDKSAFEGILEYSRDLLFKDITWGNVLTDSPVKESITLSRFYIRNQELVPTQGGMSGDTGYDLSLNSVTSNSNIYCNGKGFIEGFYTGGTSSSDTLVYQNCKLPFIRWGEGSLKAKESTQVGSVEFGTPNVVVSGAPSFEFEVLTPCTVPQANIERKLTMLVNNDADRFTVMATFGCCFTEDVWDKFCELKRMAKSERHMIRY